MLSHDELLSVIPYAFDGVDIPSLGEKIQGKVRDIYRIGEMRILITSDRVSAFDRVLGRIPYKGQVLNQLSLWWFRQVEDIIPNHVIESPDVNVTIAREADIVPVEVVVRGFITGVTSTSMWTLYERGDHMPYGIWLPEGLKKNDALPAPVITPTTKATGGGHDERLTRKEILQNKIVDESLWLQIEETALELFKRGQKVAREAGLTLVDTKYEFGTIDRSLVLIDEIHTPDSSRFWTSDTYGQEGEPEHFDKEYLRKWYISQGYSGDGIPPELPKAFIAEVAERYISAYERLTGQVFEPGELPVDKRVIDNLSNYVRSAQGIS